MQQGNMWHMHPTRHAHTPAATPPQHSPLAQCAAEPQHSPLAQCAGVGVQLGAVQHSRGPCRQYRAAQQHKKRAWHHEVHRGARGWRTRRVTSSAQHVSRAVPRALVPTRHAVARAPVATSLSSGHNARGNRVTTTTAALQLTRPGDHRVAAVSGSGRQRARRPRRQATKPRADTHTHMHTRAHTHTRTAHTHTQHTHTAHTRTHAARATLPAAAPSSRAGAWRCRRGGRDPARPRQRAWAWC
jgi:hypothetical protein